MTVVAFIASWIVLGFIVAWCTHSKTVTGKRDDQ